MVKITVNEPFSPIYFNLYGVTYSRKRDGVLVFAGDDNEAILTAARFTFGSDVLISIDGGPYIRLCDTVSRPPKNRRKARKNYTRRDTVTVICDGVEKTVDRPRPSCDTVSHVPAPAESPAYNSGINDTIGAEVIMECWKTSGRMPSKDEYKAAYKAMNLKFVGFDIA